MSQPSSQQNAANGSMYRQYNESARHANENAHVMPIYSATYSGVNVYEMEVNGVAVMRRQNDSWLNATQILKVAGVDKGRRTKILEKEIQTGEHEKVQGGYGKYQGTWIPFDRGLEVCRQYGVEDALQTLLTHNMRLNGEGPSTDIDTPTKEQAMAAQRKRMYNAASESRSNGMSGTFFKNISSMATTAVAAISKARFDSPGPRNRSGPTRAPSFNRQSSMASMDDFPGNSQQSFVSDYGQHMDSAYSTQNDQQANGDGPEPPRKRPRISMTPADSFGYNGSMDMYANTFPGSPTEPNESFIYSQAGVNSHSPSQDPYTPLRPLPFEVSPDAENKRSMLMSLFMDASANDQAKHEMLQSLTPLELDMPIDAQSHTALHWAATLSRMRLLHALIACGANPFRVNASGETALMRACVVTNSMDLNSFPELLDVLGGTIDVRDDKGRTVLHHIAVTSAVKGRNIASRYYLESLLEWVVKQGSAPSSQQAPAGNVNGPPSLPARMGLGRFMSEIVNAQDHSGDTALNIAARIGNRSIISQLLEVGADPNIANRAGLRPLDFGIGIDGADDRSNGDTAGVDKNGAPSSSQKGRESSDEVVNSIAHLLTETSTLFQSELRTKHQAIDALHASLRTTSTQVGEARRALEALQEKVREQQLARQKVSNLSHACKDEEFHVRQLEQSQGRLDVQSAEAWETELDMAVEAARTGNGGSVALPSTAVLRARINAVRMRSNETKRAVSALKGQSRDVELKYKHLVSLCTRTPDAEVDTVLDGLTRAVESEKGDLEITRIRKFLGGVEEVAH
ncbi:Start control protein cdc10 [Coniochaeta hoffmannii]|uniref:Transcription factor SWI6 n=1 Tax=Coniochaeta hoffmannii TaxID=91930 RepID=A0AA38RK24_9PEZI|nr:Start control protein cdc10 [Coniochaeta hoffmannii]